MGGGPFARRLVPRRMDGLNRVGTAMARDPLPTLLTERPVKTTTIPMSTRIGLFGGAFDPIHHGHLIIARCVQESLRLEDVVFLPIGTPPHKDATGLAPAPDRSAMVRLAIKGQPNFTCDDHDITCDGPCFTLHTVQHFQAQHPQAELQVEADR